MAAEVKKPNYPSKTCPKCGDLIQARSQTHEKCGWAQRKAKAPAKAAPAAKRKVGRPAGSKNASSTGSVSMADIQAVKALTDKIGAKKVVELAQVFA